MRNLKIVQKKQTKAGTSLFQQVQNDSSDTPVTSYCLGDHSILYVCHDGILSRISLEDNRIEPQVLCEDREALLGVVQMQFVATTGMIYLASGKGSFIQFMLHGNEVEELFQSEQGIAYFSVSPDCRSVAIVTKKNTLLMLTLPDLETLSQSSLVDVDGDAAVGVCGESVKVVWREDSSYFCVNFKQGEDFRIKIFDETGGLHSKTEDENGLLDSVLAWQPSGGLIGAVGRTPHGTVISFFELNGLKRADFYPYEGKTEKYEANSVKHLAWNASSDIFAVVYGYKVELWCRNNYVWMLKVILNGPNSEPTNKAKLTFVSWDHERSNRIHIVDENGNYATYDVAFTYTSGFCDGSAMVASWNGDKVHCTPFKNSCCPPPQCLFQERAEDDIVAVIIPEFWNGLLAVSIDGTFTFWCYEAPDELVKLKKIKVSEPNLSETHDWLWPARNTICCVSNGTLVLFEIQNWNLENNNNDKAEIRSWNAITNQVVSTSLATREREETSILIQNEQGLVLKFDLGVEDSIPVCKFPQLCTEIQALSESVIVGHDPLTRKLMLGWSKYPDCDAVILSNDCTSFCVFQNNVIFTTIQGSLEIRNMDYITKFLEKHVLGKEFDSEDETAGRCTRKCEKGSLIVRCCLNQMLEPSLILQIIPRGNLEIIYPRPLVIDTVKVIMREKENSSRYEKIMAALRRHRIDYRVLIDEMRSLIKEETDCRLEELLKTMVEQVKDSHSLVLLVTDLNQDYSDCISIIKNILEVVIKENSDKRMPHVEESYLAAMAKLGLLEDALKSPLILGEAETNRDIVRHRVKFLSFYCDNPDILFDTALGTYDLSLASLVADCLSKDPKEYIPVLDGFQSLLELQRRFKIDDKLKRYAKAVLNMVRDQRVQHDEIVKYMERHRLFTDVIRFLTRKLKFDEGGVVERSGEDTALLLREAQSSYAQYLEERGKLLEASILYRDARDADKAINCCAKSGHWELGLEIAYEDERDEEKLKKIYKDILRNLEEKKMYADAARLCETYIGDASHALYFWMKDKKWQHAATLSLKTPSLGKAFRDENIKPKLLESSNELKDSLQQTIEDIESKVERLQKVRERKATRLAETGGAGDAFSDTESFVSGSSTSGSLSSSNMSGKSYRSGKNKRKQERKVYSLKEGSKYEDLGIIAHLWNVIDKMQVEIKPDVSYSIESLWKFNESDAAVSLFEILEKTVQVVDRSIQEVWKTPITDEILETKYRIPPVTWTPLLQRSALQEPSSKANLGTR